MARSGDKDSGEYWVFIAWGSKDSSVEARCLGVSKVGVTIKAYTTISFALSGLRVGEMSDLGLRLASLG